MPAVTYALEWDKDGERYYETGVKRGVLYPKTGENNTYAAGVVWNGLTSVSESPEGGDANDMWADDIKYASLRSVETFGGTIEAYTYPDEFEECDGTASPANGVKLGQQPRKPFGFCYRTSVGSDTDTAMEAYKLHIVYGATASPSEKTYETINDSPEGMTFSWEFDTVPVPVAGYKPVSLITIDSRTADPTKLANLEQILYGTPAQGQNAAVPARLPLPDEIINTIFAQ